MLLFVLFQQVNLHKFADFNVVLSFSRVEKLSISNFICRQPYTRGLKYNSSGAWQGKISWQLKYQLQLCLI